MSVFSEYAMVIGSIGWILAVLALIVKTDWKSGTDSCRRRFSFVYDFFVLTFVSITFVVALRIEFPDLTIVNNTLKHMVKNGNELKKQNKKIIEGFMYYSESTKTQFTELCHEHTDNFALPDVVRSQLGLTDADRVFEIHFYHFSSFCERGTEQFACRCQLR